jgi:hypothetical protein
MYAAIKTLEDTLLIRRLQARELVHEGGQDPERLAALNTDIAGLEKGLKMLTEADDGRQTTDGGPENQSLESAIGNLARRPCQTSRKSEIPQNAPQRAIPAQNRPEAR